MELGPRTGVLPLRAAPADNQCGSLHPESSNGSRRDPRQTDAKLAVLSILFHSPKPVFPGAKRREGQRTPRKSSHLMAVPDVRNQLTPVRTPKRNFCPGGPSLGERTNFPKVTGGSEPPSSPF